VIDDEASAINDLWIIIVLVVVGLVGLAMIVVYQSNQKRKADREKKKDTYSEVVDKRYSD